MTNHDVGNVHPDQSDGEKHIWNRGANMNAHVHGTKDLSQIPEDNRSSDLTQQTLLY